MRRKALSTVAVSIAVVAAVAIAAAFIVSNIASRLHRNVVSPQQRMAVEAGVIRQLGIPIYPGTLVVEGYVTTGRHGQSIRALFMRTTDPISKVADFYKLNVPRGSKNSILLEGESGSANFSYHAGRVEKQVTLSTGDKATEIELLSISPR